MGAKGLRNCLLRPGKNPEGLPFPLSSCMPKEPIWDVKHEVKGIYTSCLLSLRLDYGMRSAGKAYPLSGMQVVLAGRCVAVHLAYHYRPSWSCAVVWFSIADGHRMSAGVLTTTIVSYARSVTCLSVALKPY